MEVQKVVLLIPAKKNTTLLTVSFETVRFLDPRCFESDLLLEPVHEGIVVTNKQDHIYTWCGMNNIY